MARYEGVTNPLLEVDFSNGASLVLTRFSAWLRLTVLFASNLELKLRALGVFLRATDGQRFLTEFLEVGGLMTVLQILSLDGASDDDVRAALEILSAVARVGRAFKELISEGSGEDGGIKAVALCLANTSSVETQDAAVGLLQALGEGNPKYLDSVRLAFLLLLPLGNARVQQMAAQSLQMLLTSRPPPSEVYIKPALLMLRSTNLKVQYEAVQLFKIYARFEALQEQMLSELVSLLSPSRDIMDVVLASSKAGALSRASLARNSFLTRDPTSSGIIPAAFPQQAAAAKILGILASTRTELGVLAVNAGAVSGLLRAVSNTLYFPSQRQAAATLDLYAAMFPELGMGLVEAMGDRLFDTLVVSRTTTALKALSVADAEDLAMAAANMVVSVTAIKGGAEVVGRNEDDGDDSASKTPKASPRIRYQVRFEMRAGSWTRHELTKAEGSDEKSRSGGSSGRPVWLPKSS
mgnify:CR=1 FL=1